MIGTGKSEVGPTAELPKVEEIPADSPESIAQSVVPYTVLAYIAGILDGEGSVSIKRQQYKHYNPSFTLSVRICNTAQSVIDFIQNHLGGKVYEPKKKTVSGRPVLELSWNAKQAQRVLKLLLPYLVIKRQLAELGIAFQDVVDSKICDLGPGTPLSELELEVREVFYAGARALQLRGNGRPA